MLKLVHSESMSEIRRNFRNLVQEKEGDKLVRSWGKIKVLRRIKEEMEHPSYNETKKGTWIGHILRRNCVLKCVIEGKIEWKAEATRRRGRRRKQLLDVLKVIIWYRKLEKKVRDSCLLTLEEAVDQLKDSWRWLVLLMGILCGVCDVRPELLLTVIKTCETSCTRETSEVCPVVEHACTSKHSSLTYELA